MPPESALPRDTIELVMPSGRAWHAVVRLVLGGIADRMNLGFEDLDDLQLAVERLLVEAAADESVRISVELLERGVRTRIGPLPEGPIADALQGPAPPTGELTLRRILDTVVDSFGIEDTVDGRVVVRLDKAVRRA